MRSSTLSYHVLVVSHLVGPTPATSLLVSKIMSGLDAKVMTHDVNFAALAPQKPKLYPLSLVALPGHEKRMEKFAQSIPYLPTLNLIKEELNRIIASDSGAKVIIVAYGLSIHPAIEVTKEYGAARVIALVGISPILKPPVATQFQLQTLAGITVPVFLVGSVKDKKFDMGSQLLAYEQQLPGLSTALVLEQGHHSFDIPSIIMNGKPKNNPHYKKGVHASPAYTALYRWVKDNLRGK
jgi:hypothetical protein